MTNGSCHTENNKPALFAYSSGLSSNFSTFETSSNSPSLAFGSLTYEKANT